MTRALRRRVLGPARTLAALAFAVAVAVAGATLVVAPASAAACSSDSGVTVVVDYQDLGGGIQTVCDVDGAGDSAASLFSENGFPLRYAQRQPGMVCQVEGLPADAGCVQAPPADAYWSLWWSDGRSGSWSYASAGVTSLTVPDGGYVAFAWDSSSGQVQPGLAPTAHTSTPPSTPSTPPTTGAGAGGGSEDGPGDDDRGRPGGTVSSPAPDDAPAPSPSQPAASEDTPADGTGGQERAGDAGGHGTSGRPAKQDRSPGRDSGSRADRGDRPSPADAGDEPTATAEPELAPASADAPAAQDDGLPAWVAPVLVLLLFAAVGTTALLRRRGTARP